MSNPDENMIGNNLHEGRLVSAGPTPDCMQEYDKGSFGANLHIFSTSNEQNVPSDQVAVRILKYSLKPFQALRVYCIFAVEGTTLSGAILAERTLMKSRLPSPGQLVIKKGE